MSPTLVRALGFFAASYDLMVMNVVNVVLAERFGTSVFDSGLRSAVSAAALIGAAVGQVLFGVLGDVYGRRVSHIATCALMALGSLLCACSYGGSPERTLWFLAIARGILGIGVGGEYPLAATTIAEDASSVHDRNRNVALTFSLQGVASVTSAILGNLLIQALTNAKSGVNSDARLDAVWRLLLALGAVPALVLLFYRTKAEETKAFVACKKRRVAAERNGLVGTPTLQFVLRNYGKALLGTAGTWFLFDIAFYAQNMFSSTTLAVIGVTDASLQVVSTQNAFVALMALPGYYVAVFFINSVGRQTIQMQGFAFMTVLFLCLATLWDDLDANPVAFVLLYGLALFFSNFGPNMSTFVMPTEMFPTPIRSSLFGISAAAGKAGAALGSFGFGIWVEHDGFGYSGAFYAFSCITLAAIPLTWFCMKDSELTVEDMDDEFFERLNSDDALVGDNYLTAEFNSPLGVGVAPYTFKRTSKAAYPLH